MRLVTTSGPSGPRVVTWCWLKPWPAAFPSLPPKPAASRQRFSIMGQLKPVVPSGNIPVLTCPTKEILDRPIAAGVLKQRAADFLLKAAAARYLILFDRLISHD